MHLFGQKSRLDSYERKKFEEAREKSNPYESIGKAIFQNRAALKMANMDAIFSLTKVAAGQTLRFADVCAGPGGFTEYIFWKRKNQATGIGFTLAGPDDWKLNRFNAEALEYCNEGTFHKFYGSKGTGDVTRDEHQQEFAELVKQRAVDGKDGLDLLVADGGASVEGSENLQEVKMKQLVLCQFLAGLSHAFFFPGSLRSMLAFC